MGKMIRRPVHLEKPSLGQVVYEWVSIEEPAMIDRQAMKDVVNAIYRAEWDLCTDCAAKENPEPLLCDNCKEKDK